MNYKSKLMGLSLILSAALSACSDEMESGLRPANSDYIAFTVDMPGSEGWTDGNNTRAAADSAASPINYAPIQMEGTLDGKPLYLHTEVSEGFPSDNQPLTRGTQINKSEQISKFSVSAWYGTTAAFYMEDVEVKNDPKAGVWKPDGNWLWPNRNGMKFLALSPFDLKIKKHPLLSAFTYETPSDVSKQVDLMIAYTGPLNSPTSGSTTPIALTFKHKLTAVKFVAGDELPSCTVKSITLKNVKSRMILDGENYDHWWENYGGSNELSNTSNFTLDINKKVLGNPGDAITAEDQTFFMIPQTLPSIAEIEVVLTDDVDNTQHTLTAIIGGQEWQMGKTVVYKLSASSINWTYTLEAPSYVTCAAPNITSRGFNITSTRTREGEAEQQVPWTAQFSTDNGATWTDTPPAWFSDFPTSAPGSISFGPFPYDDPGESTYYEVTSLRNASVKGTKETPYNLANSTGASSVQNTANCYVVNTPGWYSFPLVYGNAIKNGSDNKSAYTSTASGANILTSFINHAGAGIKDPYLVSNGCSPKTAELVWQDARHLVTDIQYNAAAYGNKGSISFYVDPHWVLPGNAVIAIKDAADNVLWSWHIWVTNRNMNETIEVTNRKGENYKFMPVNLGWCEGFSVTYPKRDWLIKITAAKNSKVVRCQAKNMQDQDREIDFSFSPSSPYYQWGRKDPFQPLNQYVNKTPSTTSPIAAGGNNNKTLYDSKGNELSSNPTVMDFSTGTTCIKNYILHPDVMHSVSHGDNTYANLWNTNFNNSSTSHEKVVKTIYDPCPVGYKLPAMNAFTGFTPKGGDIDDGQGSFPVPIGSKRSAMNASKGFTKSGVRAISNEVNGTWNEHSKGWNFYANPSGNTIFFPALGERLDINASLSNIFTVGYYWTARSLSNVSGSIMYFSSNGVDLDNNHGRACGHSVRPVTDD